MVGEQRVDAKAGAGARDGGEGNYAASGDVCGFMSTVRGVWVKAEISGDSKSGRELANGGDDAAQRTAPAGGNSELQIFAPPLVLDHPSGGDTSDVAVGGEQAAPPPPPSSDLQAPVPPDLSKLTLDDEIDPKHSRSLSAYHRVNPSSPSFSTARVGRNGAKLPQRSHARGASQMQELAQQSGGMGTITPLKADPVMHRLVVYKRGPMLMLMVVNAAGMQHADANDDSKQDSSGTSGAEASISSSAAALGEGAKSLPSFCRLVNRHVGKPLGQLRFMLESGYPKLDVSYFNAASPGGQTDFLTRAGTVRVVRAG